MRWVYVLCSLVLFPATAKSDSDYQPPEFIQESVSLPAGVAGESLSLADALAEAVANNLGVVLAKGTLRVAEVGRKLGRGQFEPSLTGSYTHFDSLTPPSTAQEGTSGDNLSFKSDAWRVGLSQRIRTGTTLSLDFSNSRASSALGTAVDPLLYRAGLEVRATQSLLRGFSLDLDVPSATILRAELASDQAVMEMRRRMIVTVQNTEMAYWRLVEVLKNYQVETASVQRAREQLDLTRRQIASGLLAPASMIEAESALASRELALVHAEAAIQEATDVLRRVLGRPVRATSMPILPTAPPSFESQRLSEAEVIKIAKVKRPEVASMQLASDQAHLELRIADNERLPQLDVSVGYGLVGQDDVYGGTLDRLVSNDSRSWSVGLNFSWTPLGRAARARQEIAELRRMNSRTRLRDTLAELELEVRRAVRELDTSERALRAAARFRDLSARSLETEQRKFVSGTSSNFLVTQRQDALRQAQLAELRALVRHKLAKTNLHRVAGTLLDERNIELDTKSK